MVNRFTSLGKTRLLVVIGWEDAGRAPAVVVDDGVPAVGLEFLYFVILGFEDCLKVSFSITFPSAVAL